MYYLNDKKIDFDRIVDLSLSDSGDRWFLNIKTGKLKKNLKKDSWDEDYYEVPKISSFERFDNLKEYAEEMMDDTKAAERILFFLKKEDYNEAMKFMKESEDYKYYGFQTWENMPAADFIFDWLSDLPVDFKEEWEYDCDCPICMATQEAEKQGRQMGLSEIKEVFKEADDLQFLNDSWNKSNQKDKTVELVEKNLVDILEDKKITLEEVKKRIYKEGKNMTPIEASMDFQKWWMTYFESDIEKGVSIKSIMDIFTDAWNYFPHKSLNGKSPNEMVLDYQKKSQENS